MKLAPIPQHILNGAHALLSPYCPNLTVDKIQCLAKAEEAKPEISQRLLKTADLVERLGLCRVHISRLAERGEFERIDVGIERSVYRYTPESVEEFIKRRAKR